MSTIVITGSASGIGAATRKRLEGAGHRVIGVDLRDAEVVADLANPASRRQTIVELRERCAERLDGVVVCAGVGPQAEPWSTIVSLNYFGAAVILSGLRACLARSEKAAAVAVSSTSAVLPGADTALVGACLADDESAARRIALTLDGTRVYGGSKLALARWVRGNAPSADWAGQGIRLNAIAPGAVLTPLLQAGLDDPTYGEAIRNFPIPTGGFGEPDQIAAVIAYLLGPDARFFCGAVLFVDGGTDALLRPQQF